MADACNQETPDKNLSEKIKGFWGFVQNI